MLSTIKNIFNIIHKVFGIYTMIISLVESEYPDLEGTEKEKKAIEYLDNVIIKLVEENLIPNWVKDIFFSKYFKRWIISILVNAAHTLEFFKHKEEEKE